MYTVIAFFDCGCNTLTAETIQPAIVECNSEVERDDVIRKVNEHHHIRFGQCYARKARDVIVVKGEIDLDLSEISHTDGDAWLLTYEMFVEQWKTFKPLNEDSRIGRYG